MSRLLNCNRAVCWPTSDSQIRARPIKLVSRSTDRSGFLWQQISCGVWAQRRSTKELPRSTRHIALRHQRVRGNSKRLFFAPNIAMRAGGLIKTSNSHAMRIIFAPDALQALHDKSDVTLEYCNFLKTG